MIDEKPCETATSKLFIAPGPEEQHSISAGLLGDATQSLWYVRGGYLGGNSKSFSGTAAHVRTGELEAITEFAHVQKMKDTGALTSLCCVAQTILLLSSLICSV